MHPRPEESGPEAGDILPIVGIAPAVAMAVAWPTADGALDTLVWVGAFAAFGAIVGAVPAVSWAFERNHRRLWHWLAVGASAALVPMVAALVSGLLGHWLLGRGRYATWVASIGAPLPIVGIMRWTTFGVWVVEALGLGALIGLVYWLLVVDRRRPLWLSIGLAVGVVAGASGVATLLR